MTSATALSGMDVRSARRARSRIVTGAAWKISARRSVYNPERMRRDFEMPVPVCRKPVQHGNDNTGRKNKRCKEKILDTENVFMYDIQGDVMESIVKQSLLYDFYGELLTEHQRNVYEDVVFNDMSLSEIAQEQGISRQGVHDLIKRCDRILAGYEEKLHLIEKFQETKQLVTEIRELTQKFQETNDRKLIEKIEQISSDIIDL